MKASTTCRLCEITFIYEKLGGGTPILCEQCRIDSKRCWTCKRILLRETDFHKDRSTYDGISSACRTCSAKHSHDRRTQRGESVNGAYQRRVRYGITIEQWDRLAADQGGRCAICGRTPRKLLVDHCHTSGKIRGLLCDSCNKGIGHLRDDAALLAIASEYLTRAETQPDVRAV